MEAFSSLVWLGNWGWLGKYFGPLAFQCSMETFKLLIFSRAVRQDLENYEEVENIARNCKKFLHPEGPKY